MSKKIGVSFFILWRIVMHHNMQANLQEYGMHNVMRREFTQRRASTQKWSFIALNRFKIK